MKKVRSEELGVDKWFMRSKRRVIPSLLRDLGSAAKENFQRLSNHSAKILQLRTSCSAQNDKFGQLLTPNS